MDANFTPTLGDYRDLQPFRYWCQKVIPLVYDDSLSYYELLCKVVDYLNKTMEDVGTLHGDVVNLHTAYQQLQDYVNNYFDNLDVQEEINKKLDEMAESGDLSKLINNPFTDSNVIETYFTNTLNQQTKIWYCITELQPNIYFNSINNNYNSVKIANNNFVNISINGGLFDDNGAVGYMRKNNVTLKANTPRTGQEILGYKNGTLLAIDSTLSTEEIDALNLEWAIQGFYSLLKDGIITEQGNDDDDYHPRSWIAQSENKFLIGTCWGRTKDTNGLTQKKYC